MSGHLGTNNKRSQTRTSSDSKITSNLSPSRSGRRDKTKSWDETDVSRMAPNDQKLIPTSPRKKGSSGGSTPRTGSHDESKRMLNREKMSNGFQGKHNISINVYDDESENDEARDSVFSPIGDRPLISILKVPGRARSQSLPPNMILQQISEGASLLGSNSKLVGLLKRESSDESSTENLGPPAGYSQGPRRVSFSLPFESDESGSGSSTPSYHLLPPLGGGAGGRLSPNLLTTEQGKPRKGSPYPYDNGSSESLDSDHRSPGSSRPSSAPKEIDIQRDPLPTGSSTFQMAMAEVSDADSSKNSDSSDSESNTQRSRTKVKTNASVKNNKNERNYQYLTPNNRHSGPSQSLSPRRLSTNSISPRRGTVSVSPRRGIPSSGVSPRRPSKSDKSGSRHT